MKRLVLLTLLFSFGLMTNSCSNDDEPNFNFIALKALQAELPESFELNNTYQIKVTYERPDDCSFFERFEVTSSDTTIRNVTAFGFELTDRDCSEIAEEVEASFDFIVLHNQPYTFRFWQGRNETGEHQFFEVIVPVN